MTPEQERWFVADRCLKDIVPSDGPFKEKSVANAICELRERRAIGWGKAVISESTQSLIEQSK